MKRMLVSVLAMACVGLALAQAPFTIVRPSDGSKVREAVHILFPKNSIPDGGYVGIFVNGKFIEATLPAQGSKYMDYTLDTKGLHLADGPLNVEAVLYVDFQEKPRIIDKSSIQVTLANSANITVPEGGISMRYHWAQGREWNYHYQITEQLDTINEAQARMGGHASQTPVSTYGSDVVYAMDTVYPDGDALLRMFHAIPKGKTSVVLATEGGGPRRYFENQMWPLYMRVHSTGMEVYGVVPQFFPTFGIGSGNVTPGDLVADNPLPTLPTGKVKPGDIWQTRFQLKSDEQLTSGRGDSLTMKIPARAEFVDVEWEMGYPCAKIHHSFSVNGGGSPEAAIGATPIRSNAQSIDETYWYALDRGVIVKMVRNITRDRRVDNAPAAPAAGGAAGTGGGRPGGGAPGPHLGRPPTAGGGGWQTPINVQRARGAPGMGGYGGMGGPSGGGSNGPMGGGPPLGYNPGAGNNNNRSGTIDQPATSNAEFVRVIVTEVYTLQK
jgi:hypothetical protein